MFHKILKGSVLIDPDYNVICVGSIIGTYRIPGCICAYKRSGSLYYVRVLDGICQIRYKCAVGDNLLLEDPNVGNITNIFCYDGIIIFCADDKVLYFCGCLLNIVYPYNNSTRLPERCLGICRAHMMTDSDMEKISGFRDTYHWKGNELFLYQSKDSIEYWGDIQDAYVENMPGGRLTSVLIDNEIVIKFVYRHIDNMTRLKGRWLTAPIPIGTHLYAVNTDGVLKCLSCVWSDYVYYNTKIVGDFHMYLREFMFETTGQCLLTTVSDEGIENFIHEAAQPIFHDFIAVRIYRSKNAMKR